MFKTIVVSCLLGLSLLPMTAHAHGGHNTDPHHLHQRLGDTEVTLQYLSSEDYLHQLHTQKMRVPDGFDRALPVFLIILEAQKTRLNTRIKLKITDASGKTVGDPKGITPMMVNDKHGVYYLTQQALPKSKVLVMVQFMGANGIQRAGFTLTP